MSFKLGRVLGSLRLSQIRVHILNLLDVLFVNCSSFGGRLNRIFLIFMVFAIFWSFSYGVYLEQPLLGDDQPIYRETFAFLLGLWFLYFLVQRLRATSGPFRFAFLLRPFPDWNFFLFLAAPVCILFPVSTTLQNVGVLPLLVCIVLFDGICSVLVRKKLELGTLTALVGLLVFVWMWELAGNPHLSVLPTDLPEVRDPQFTSLGVSKALLTEINNWSPSKETIKEPAVTPPTGGSRQTGPDISSLIFESRERASRLPFPSWLDAPHILGHAEVGGIALAPVYHMLRHLRHKRTLEAQILIGNESWTLALRQSDFATACFSEKVPETLLSLEFEPEGKKVLDKLEAVVVEDLRSHQWGGPQCNPDWPHKLLAFLGVADVPITQDERISNVTVAGKGSDEQLATLIRRAVLEGIGKIYPALLGLYYDKLGRVESAFFYYRKALPQAVLEASRNRGSREARRKLAGLYMRIADLETWPSRDQDTSWQGSTPKAFSNSSKHYKAAIAVSPDYALTYANYGYFLISRTRAFHANILNHATQENDKIGIFRIPRTRDNYKISIFDDAEARNNYKEAARILELLLRRYKASSLQSEFRSDVANSLRIFPYTATAYAKALEAELLPQSDLDREKLLSQAESVLSEVPEQQRDNREYITLEAYIRLLQGKVQSKECETFVDRLLGIPQSEPSGTFSELALFQEERASSVLYSCLPKKGSGILGMDSKLVELNLSKFSYHARLADFYFRYRRFDASDKNLVQAIEEVGNLFRELKISFKGLAPFHSIRGEHLWKQACDRQRPLLEEKREEIRRQAVAEFKEAFRLDPEMWHAQSAKARVLAMSSDVNDKVMAEALANATSAVKVGPSNGNWWADLGIVQLRLGKISEALESFEKASKLAPDDAEIHYLLNYTHLQNGTIEWAREGSKYGRSLDPERWGYIANPLPGCGPTVRAVKTLGESPGSPMKNVVKEQSSP